MHILGSVHAALRQGDDVVDRWAERIGEPEREIDYVEADAADARISLEHSLLVACRARTYSQ